MLKSHSLYKLNILLILNCYNDSEYERSLATFDILKSGFWRFVSVKRFHLEIGPEHEIFNFFVKSSSPP